MRKSLLGAVAALLPVMGWTAGTDRRVTVMAYNVENLFDAADDFDPALPPSVTNQQDPTYLPMSVKRSSPQNRCLRVPGNPRDCDKSAGRWSYRCECENLDWTHDRYQKKLATIARVVLDVNGGNGPDVLILEEIEKESVVADLQKHLPGFVWRAHFESPSARGIDVAMISRISMIRKEAFPVATPAPFHNTRDILEAEFELHGVRFIVAANHWPSQASKTPARLAAASVLKARAEVALQRGLPFLAAGDFNTLPKENPNPIEGTVANPLTPSPSLPLVDLMPDIVPGRFPEGTNYYRGHWSPLDRILITPDLLESGSVVSVADSGARIIAFDYLFTQSCPTCPRYPNRYDFDTGEGFSDHLPIVIDLIVRTPDT